MFITKAWAKSWGCVFISGVLELFWMSGLKFSQNWWHYAITALIVVLSFACLIQAIKSIEVGVAYSVYVGIGAVGIVLVEIFFVQGELTFFKLFLISLIFLAVIGLKLDTRRAK